MKLNHGFLRLLSNFAWSEMLVIAIVAILVVGPKDLPGMLRSVGKTIGSLKRMAGDFQRQMSDALDEAELDEIKDLAKKSMSPLDEANKTFEKYAKDVNESIMQSDESKAYEASVKEEAAAKPVAKKPKAKATPKTAKKPVAKRAAAKPKPAKKQSGAKA